MATKKDHANESSINLSFFSGSGSIWNTEEWRKLREARIVGALIGSIAQQQHQVQESGFPLILTKNETTLLLEKNLAVLWDCSHLQDSPSEDAKFCLAQRHVSFANQRQLLVAQRRAELLEKTELIVRGKLAKRRKLDPSIDETVEKQKLIDEELAKIVEPADYYLYVQICTEDPSSDKSKIIPWTYPESEQGKLEYATYRDLWERGFWVTSGSKFGGTFLAYPGDPLLYHAEFIVNLTRRDEKISPLDIIAMARLANSTRKTAVLAYFDSALKITYQSLVWANQ